MKCVTEDHLAIPLSNYEVCENWHSEWNILWKGINETLPVFFTSWIHMWVIPENQCLSSIPCARCMKHGELCRDCQVVYQASSSVRVQRLFLGKWTSVALRVNGGHGCLCMGSISSGSGEVYDMMFPFTGYWVNVYFYHHAVGFKLYHEDTHDTYFYLSQ